MLLNPAMKTKHKPALAGDSQIHTTPLSIVEEILTETNDVGDSKELLRSESDAKANPEPDEDFKKFAQLNEVVLRGLLFFIEVGLALAKIRQQALWKAGGYKSWGAYCKAVTGKSRIHVNRKIRGAQTAQYLSKVKPIGSTLAVAPRCESQVRPLGGLKTNDDRATAWYKAVELAGGQPTKKIVQFVVNEMRNQAGKPSPKTKWKDELIDFIARLRDAILEEQPRTEIENLISELETNLKI